MSKIEYKTFGQKLAMYTAPTLLGIKCGSLISLSTKEFDIHTHMNIFNSKASKKALKIRKLYDYNQRSLLLIYNEKLMQKRLANTEVKGLLSYFGYFQQYKTTLHIQSFYSVASNQFIFKFLFAGLSKTSPCSLNREP